MNVIKKIDRFEIIKELGKGLQGVVYLGNDQRLERYVAIKTLHKRFLNKDDKQRRLIQEAKTVSKLQHPNIIPLFEAGEFEGLVYLVFEYVDGLSLKDQLKKDGPFMVHKAIKFMMEILDGVSCAHERGIIHRDLTPSNIMIDKTGRPRIMDFGISVIEGNPAKQEEKIAGTPYYMSPEHFKEGKLCKQSDIFSLGLIFYEILVGQPAIQADNDFTVMYKIANETIPMPSMKNPDVDKKLEGIIMKAVEKNIETRYAEASHMKKELADYLKDYDETSDGQTDNRLSHSTIDFLLRKIRHKSDFPAFSNNIIEINKKASTSDAYFPSVSELANVILRDYSLTSKLLKLVNTAFYGQFAGKITTISRAIVVLGFDQVRMAASSLMLFNQLKNKNQMIELREAAVGSFVSGMIAKDLAERMRLPGTEEAFICSMLHNLGKHLVLYYFEEEYRQIRDLMTRKGLEERMAAKSVIGIAYEALGMGIARAWQFPDKIIKSMESLPKGKLEKPKSEEEMFRNLSCFSNELCRIINNEGEGDVGDSLSKLLERFGESIPLLKKQISGLLESAKEKVEEYSGLYNVNLKQSIFFKKIDEYLGTKHTTDGSDGETRQAPEEFIEHGVDYDDLEIDNKQSDTLEIKDTQTILINGIQDITNTLLEEYNLNDVLTMILETIYRGFMFQRVIFCVMNPRNNIIGARFGLGKDVDKILDKFQFQISRAPDVFNFSVSQFKDIAIENANDPQFVKRIPQWYHDHVSASAFVLYPIIANKRPVGLIYADRELPGKVISGNQYNFMKTLCNQAVLAIKQARQG